MRSVFAGACRQVLSEFGEMEVFCLAPDGSVTRNMISELLPFAFNKETLDKMTKEAS